MADPTLHLADSASVADLGTYLRRASRADPGGAVRLSVHRSVLAAYVCPVVGGGGPTVLGLRTFALAQPDAHVGGAPGDVDVVVPLAAMADRLARPENGTDVPVPPATVAGLPWTGIAPPRSGWQPGGNVPGAEVVGVAEAGIAEIAAGSPDVAGAPAVAALRARVWGRVLPGTTGVPAGAAFVAHALGFVTAHDEAALFTAGPWTRLTTSRGHVLARNPLLSSS